MSKYYKTEVGEDCISRANLIKSFLADCECESREEAVAVTLNLEDVLELIEEEPSVIPKAKEGEWIPDLDGGFKCSNCRAEEDEFIYGTGMRYVNGESEFCPNCGAKMKGAR